MLCETSNKVAVGKVERCAIYGQAHTDFWKNWNSKASNLQDKWRKRLLKGILWPFSSQRHDLRSNENVKSKNSVWWEIMNAISLQLASALSWLLDQNVGPEEVNETVALNVAGIANHLIVW